MRETLDAAERDAKAARDAHRGVYASDGDAEWYFNATDGVFTKPHGIQVTPGVPYVDPDVEPHIARQSPAAVLRRITADRQILEEHKTVRVLGWAADWVDSCAVCGPHRVPCPTVRLLAEGYGWSEDGDESDEF